MAENNIVIGSRFKPFSYSELLQPVQVATAAHQDLENKYSELETKANIWDQIADEQNDPYAYKMYKTYSDDLKSQAEILAKEGLTPASRQSVMDLRNRYSSEIVPIEQAYTRRRQLADEQRKLRSQDGTIMFDRDDIGSVSLDDFIRNPELSYRSYSGSILAKQTAEAAKNLVRRMKENPKEWSSILGGQYYESRLKRGYSPEEITAAINNAPNAPKELIGIVEEVIGSSGIRDWKNKEIINRAYGYIAPSLWNALGDTTYQNVANRGFSNDTNSTTSVTNASTSRLPYRRINQVSVDPRVNTRSLGEELRFLDEVEKNPDAVLGEKTTVTRRKTIPYTSRTFKMIDIPYGEATGTETIYKNRDRFEDLSKRYGTSNINELRKKINDDISSSAIKTSEFILNYTDNSPMNQIIEENLIAMSSDNKAVPAYEYKGGRKRGQLSLSDIEDIDFNKGKLRYDPKVGLIYDYRDNRDRQKSMLINASAIDTPDGTLSAIQEDINHAYESEDYDMVSRLSDVYMRVLDGIFNSRAKIQSNTDSKLSIEYPSIRLE